jgi:HTH-type transcriptional regulator / antitoxin HigA
MTQTIDLKVYSQLVAEVTPKVIETEEEYEQFLAVAERLTFNRNPTPEESALYDLVAMLVESYEAQHYPIEEPSPAELLIHIIESSETDTAELISIFGSNEVLNRVLAGLQPIDFQQSQALANKFSLPSKIFLNSKYLVNS